jgi:glycosyltransferase involved in cell wall biosynthesis
LNWYLNQALEHPSTIESVAQQQKNKNMGQLSVAIITLNEEKNIAACIEGVREIADEIIIVDSLSTDKTVEIASSLGAKIISQKFLGHIEQKNLALQSCAYEFVLSLDADERLDANAIAAIKQQKEKGFPHDGYVFKRLTFIGKDPIKYGAWYPDKKLRLVKKELAEWKGINPHDTLSVNNTNIITLKGNMLHYSFVDKQDVMENTKRFAEISAQHLHSLGKSIPSVLIPFKAFGRWFKHMFLKGGIVYFKYGWFLGKQQYYDCYCKYTLLHSMTKEQKSKK